MSTIFAEIAAEKYNNIYSIIAPSKFGTKASTWFIIVIKINIIVFQHKVIN